MPSIFPALVVIGIADVAIFGRDQGDNDRVAPLPAENRLDAGTGRIVTASALRLREQPSTDCAVKTTLAEGTHVSVLRTEGAWVEVRLPNGEQGWMHGAYPIDPMSSVRHQDVVGRAQVTDGDTIRIGSVEVRLQGIDAPEAGQSCEDRGGQQAWRDQRKRLRPALK